MLYKNIRKKSSLEDGPDMRWMGWIGYIQDFYTI